MAKRMNEGSNSKHVTDEAMKSRHSLIEGYDHIERCASQIGHEGPASDENDEGGVEVEHCGATAGSGGGELDGGALGGVGAPGRGGAYEEDSDVDENEDDGEGVGETVVLQGRLHALQDAGEKGLAALDHGGEGEGGKGEGREEAREARPDGRKGTDDGRGLGGEEGEGRFRFGWEECMLGGERDEMVVGVGGGLSECVVLGCGSRNEREGLLCAGAGQWQELVCCESGGGAGAGRGGLGCGCAVGCSCWAWGRRRAGRCYCSQLGLVWPGLGCRRLGVVECGRRAAGRDGTRTNTREERCRGTRGGGGRARSGGSGGRCGARDADMQDAGERARVGGQAK